MTPSAPCAITCGINLCASNNSPRTAAKRLPETARRESWLTSVTGEFESPDNFPPVTAAIWLSVTGLSLTALDSTQARNESHTKQSEPERGHRHLPNQETKIEIDPGVTGEVSDLISTVI